MNNYTSTVNIPAYDNKNNGLILEFKLIAVADSAMIINTKGRVADALKKNLRHCIEIMASLKKSWEHLRQMEYTLACRDNQFLVKDSKSSGMALSIALINISRALHSQPATKSLAGTGILRIDGTFDHSNHEEKKYLAAKKEMKNLSQFITPSQCKNLIELENLIENLNQKGELNEAKL